MILFAALVSIVTLCCASQATSPQLPYVQSLHNQLKALPRKAARSVKGGPVDVEARGESISVVVATSIETVYAQGADLTGRRYDLEFRLPIDEGDYRDLDIHKSEILLFPNISGPLPPTVHLELAATVNSNPPVRLQYRWDTAETCASLDVTEFMKSTFRRPSSNNMGAEAALRVSIRISQPDSVLLRNKSDPTSAGACAGRRPPGTLPLIVTQYYTGAPRSPRQSEAGDQACNLTTLFINTTAIFGAKVISPLTLNIGSCEGNCEKCSSENCSFNAIAKRRLRALDPDDEALKRTYDVHCVPNSFEPVSLMVSTDRNSFVIVEIPDLVVRSCACR